MSQPPKSTIFAPAARWTALRGVALSAAADCAMETSLPKKKKGNTKHPRNRLAACSAPMYRRPLCPWYLRDYGAEYARAHLRWVVRRIVDRYRSPELRNFSSTGPFA